MPSPSSSSSTSSSSSSTSSSSSAEIGSTMKLANLPVWFLMRRQRQRQDAVRRFISLVLFMALLLGCYQYQAFQEKSNNSKNKNNDNNKYHNDDSKAVNKITTTTTQPATKGGRKGEDDVTTTKATTSTTNAMTTTKKMTDSVQSNLPNNNKNRESNDSKHQKDDDSSQPKEEKKKEKKKKKKKEKKQLSSIDSVSTLSPLSSSSNNNNNNNNNNDNIKKKKNIQFVLTDQDEFQPQIVWLMSWPNSGTSFTLNGVEKLSNKSIATNYGDEVTSAQEYSLSIYPLRIEGPYWKGAVDHDKLGMAKDLPDKYVLTKTHCGGRCSSCGPNEYVIPTAEAFLKACCSGHGRFPPRRQRHLVHYYPPNNSNNHGQRRVHGAIQLIRNPFHNVVARFHLDRRNKSKKMSKYGDWVQAHPDTAQGFHRWCRDMNTEFQDEEQQVFPANVVHALQSVPCRAEFYMYIQWHNKVHEALALLRQQQEQDEQQQEETENEKENEKEKEELTRKDAQQQENLQQQQQQQQQQVEDDSSSIPLLTIYYEDYGKDLNGTFRNILDFLELPPIGDFPEFTPRDDSYQDYYTKDERRHIQTFLRYMASNTTWNQIQHYFV